MGGCVLFEVAKNCQREFFFFSSFLLPKRRKEERKGFFPDCDILFPYRKEGGWEEG